jgi:hypothetical protein
MYELDGKITIVTGAGGNARIGRVTDRSRGHNSRSCTHRLAE